MEEKNERELTREELVAQVQEQRQTIAMLYKENADLKEAMKRMEILNRKAFECLVNADWRLAQYEANQKKYKRLGE